MNGSNKKSIKVIGVFLGVILFLTFFSKTIYNFSLPTVTVTFPAGGKLVEIVEASAQVSYVSINNIYAARDGKIKDIFVEAGQEIKKGQSLMTYELDTDHIEKLKLEIQRKQQAIHSLTMSLTEIHSDDLTIQWVRETNKIQALDNEIQNIKSEISKIENGTYDTLKKSEYEMNISIAEKILEDKQKLYNAGAVSRSEVSEAADSLEKIRMQFEQYIQSEKESKTELLKNKLEQLDGLNDEIASLERKMESASESSNNTLNDLRNQISNAQSELTILEKMLTKAEDVDVIAETDGIVIAVVVEKRLYFTAAQNKILLQVAELSNEWKVEFIVNEEKLHLLDTQNIAEVTIKGISEILTGEIIAITPYKSETGDQYVATVIIRNVSQDLAGKRADIKVKTESEKYDAIIPNYALRKDAKGYYVLVLREENSVLGKNYTAYKVSVDLLDTDGSLSAIRGITRIEPIVATSTSYLDNGSRVKYDEAGDAK